MNAELAVKMDQLPAVSVDPLLSLIERAAKDPNVDVDKLERMMAMHERVHARNAEADFNDAMNAAQSHIGRIAADKENTQTKTMYATYAALDRVVRPVYTEHGFALSFTTGAAPEGYVRVLCFVSHKGGHTRTYQADIPADGKGAKGGEVMTKTHAVGSGMQYGMRYLLKMIFNIAIGVDATDDDGNAAGANKDGEVANPIYDKIDLSESVAELQKVKPQIEGAKVDAGIKRNLIAAYNSKLKKLKGAAK